MQPWLLELPFEVTLIDTGFVRPHAAASFLVCDSGQAAFIEAGPAYAVPRLLAALEQRGLTRADVAYVIVTHVHLDHAGGAGALMAELPSAKLVVHPRGQRHLVDPSKLITGATAVYGERVLAERFGDVRAVAEERVVPAPEGLELFVGERRLLFLDTPGHALHHVVVYDERSRGLFTGDSFGLRYPELEGPSGPFVFPTTTPVQFDPLALHTTTERLMALHPERLYFTHFGAFAGDLARVAREQHRLIDAYVTLAQACAELPERLPALVAGMERLLLAELGRQGCPLPVARQRELLAMDVELNAQGLDVWLSRKER